jgi:HlyD family secretion protein
MQLRRSMAQAGGSSLACSVLILLGCQARTAPITSNVQSAEQFKRIRVKFDRLHRRVRSNGTIQAVNAVTIRVPQIYGQGGDMTLTKLIATGAEVKEGDVLAEFDRTKQVDNARDAKAKYEDLVHQVDQRKEQHRADAEKRAADLQQADADLEKARLELRKGPILSEIDRLKDQAKLEDAQAHVASLQRSGHFHDVSEAADTKILELQRDRQKVAWERAQESCDKLVIKAPISGMVSRENSWHNDTFGPAQEGDQLWPGQPLLRIFDPSTMEVEVSVSEPDGAALSEGAQAMVRLDAYPAMTFKGHFDSASPVATAQLDTSVRTFPARFRLDEQDPHLLPDLSAAVDLDVIAKEPALVVPRAAVHYREGKPFVTRVSGASGSEERAVKLGEFDDTWIEITSGLERGDEVLTPAGPPGNNAAEKRS